MGHFDVLKRMRSIFFIVCLFLLSCDERKDSFYVADFYGSTIKVPEFIQHNKEEENLKYYCENNIYLKDSLGITFFTAKLCRYRSIDNSEYDFDFLKMVVEEMSVQMQEEIPEMEILSVNSINKGNYYLYEIIRYLDNPYSKNKYSKVVYIAFESHFIYIYQETDKGNPEIMKQLDKLTAQFKGKKLFENIILPENTETCNYCHRILFDW